MASYPAAPAPDPTRPYRPPVFGTQEAVPQYIRDHTNRARSSVGTEISGMVARFVEFITSRSPGSLSLTWQEVPRWAGVDHELPLEVIVTGSNLPADLLATKSALDLLLNGCKDFIYSMGGDGYGNGIPNIFYSPDRPKFIQDIKTFETPSGFGIEGNFMMRRGNNRYYAYPFKYHFTRLANDTIQTVYNSLAFSGDWLKFIEKLLEFWDLKLVISPEGLPYSNISMMYEGEEIYLTRGSLMGSFISAFGSSNLQANSSDTIVAMIRQFRFSCRESVEYALDKVDPKNQIRLALQSCRNLSGNIPNLDYHYQGIAFPEIKRLMYEWLTGELRTKAVGPQQGGEWGVGLIEKREKIKQTVGQVESRIMGAIGKEMYDALLVNSHKQTILDMYLTRVQSRGVNFFHISEGRLELDFMEFAEEIGLPEKPLKSDIPVVEGNTE